MINYRFLRIVSLFVPSFSKSFSLRNFFIRTALLACLQGSSSPASADVHVYGCWIPDPNPNLNRIWYVLDVNHPGITHFINDLNDNGVDDTYRELQNRCPQTMGTACTVYNHSNGSVRGYGVLADFSIEYCPLDGHLSLLFLGFGLFAAWWSRKLMICDGYRLNA